MYPCSISAHLALVNLRFSKQHKPQTTDHRPQTTPAVSVVCLASSVWSVWSVVCGLWGCGLWHCGTSLLLLFQNDAKTCSNVLGTQIAITRPTPLQTHPEQCRSVSVAANRRGQHVAPAAATAKKNPDCPVAWNTSEQHRAPTHAGPPHSSAPRLGAFCRYASVARHYTLTAVGFEPTQLALVELESTPLDHSGKLSCMVSKKANHRSACTSSKHGLHLQRAQRTSQSLWD